MRKKIIFTASLTIIFTTLTFVILTDLFAYTLDAYREGEIIAEVRNKILTYYVSDTSPDKLLEGALNGMVSTLDAYSSYLDTERYKQIFEGTKGEFVGIGIEITIENGFLTVITPIDDSPAAKSGILAGDKILEINGESAERISLDEALKRLRGEIQEKVTLKVIHEGEKTPTDIEIIRDQIQIVSVKGVEIIERKNSIGYVRLVRFNQNSANELEEAIEDLKEQGMKKLVLDLRFNPGGLLNSAVDIVDLFISKGTIVYTKGRVTASHQTFHATNSTTWKLPLAIIINRGSASASEIVAGALQDYHRAIIVGSKSFGKGSVQTILPLKDERTGLKLTTARYYTPSGRCIQKEPGIEGGIFPDVLLPLELDEQRQLLNWFVLRKTEVEGEPFVDKQLLKAIEALNKKSVSYQFR